MTIQKPRTPKRPRKAEEELRLHTIGVRVNAAELADFQSKAAAVNLPLAQWLRSVGVSGLVVRPLVPGVNRQAYMELARLAGNLNQLARAAHEGRVAAAPQFLESLQRQVQELRKELLGVNRDCETG